jgi:hypothetical protein
MLVKCNIYNLENVFTWRIENIERVRISQDEEYGEVVNCTGRGVGMRLEDAKIHPYKGVTQKPTPDSRSFSFASPEFDDSSWGFCEVKALQGALDTEWVGIVDRELTAAPFAWPQNNTWTPGWIWHPDFDTEPGLGYIRKTFELDIDRKVVIVATGDNYWTLYLDGVALLGDNSYPEAWQEHRRVVIDMQAGLHTFAAVVNNIRTSPVAFLLLAYQDNGFTCVPQPDEIGPDGEVIHQDDECEPNEPLVIYVTDASWKILAYPPSEPGMTPGGVMLQLLAEAWSRSQLLDVSPDFDAIFDTDGEPWPQMPEVGARIGDSYLDILKTMTDGEWCDWWMRPVGDDGIFRLSMYVNDGRGNSTAVPFTRSTDAHLGNISDITHETPGKIFNRLLVKYGGGLFTHNLVTHQIAISEVIEEFFACDTSDLQEATRLAQREVTTSTATNPAITLTLEPDIDPLRFDKPYVDFKPGDMVYAPDEDGDAEYYRVIGATITQDDEGFPVVSLELNRRTFSVQEQRADLFQTLGSGVVSPKAISGRVDGFQGSGD